MNQINATTTEDAVKQLNNLRLDNKDQWVFAGVNVNGLDYRFKFYNTWVQIAEDPNGMRGSSGMGNSVKQFKDYLLDFFRK
jgi:hypothetical protein